MTRPRLLDLFCGAGGASVGYARAGWNVTGVDIAEQPDYPYPFHRADALDFLAEHGHDFDAVHASPPCTEHTTLVAGRSDDPTRTAGLLARTLNALDAGPHALWVVENVMGADMPTDIVLCGSMFGLRVYRHRRFRIGPGLPLLIVPTHPRHRVPAARGRRQEAWDTGHNLTVTGDQTKMGRRHQAKFCAAMGIDWISHDGVNLAIPPAYTHHLGEQMMSHLTDTVRP